MAVIDALPTAATGRSTLTCTPATNHTTAKCEVATSPTHTRAPCANTWRCTASRHLLRARATSPPPRLSSLRPRTWAETHCRVRRQPIWASGTCVTARVPAAHTHRRVDPPHRTLQKVTTIRTRENMHFNRVLEATFVRVTPGHVRVRKAEFTSPDALAHWQIHVTAKPQNWGGKLSPTWTEYELLSPPVSILL